MIRKPIIGIAGELTIGTESPVIGYYYENTRNSYAQSVICAGGIPFYVPVSSDPLIIKEQANIIDGLLLPGGTDVYPLIYDNEPLPLLEATVPMTDKFQLQLIDDIFNLGKPILGTCRGNQILNVYFGGTLYQDVSYATPSPLQHFQKTQLEIATHTIDIFEDNIIYDLFGSNTVVNSAHHQSIDQVGKGLRITALASDGIIEGIEHNSKQFIVGVQWHPEMLLTGEHSMLPLFKAFVDSAL